MYSSTTATPTAPAAPTTPDPPHTPEAPAPLSLRPYQARILATTLHHNTLVILPTGAGKTLIAAETIRRLTPPAVLLVPTVLLVKQQSLALSNHMPHVVVAQLHGGKNLNPHWQIIVSTPSAFRAAQCVDDALQWKHFNTVVFDEVHHLLKNHPYRTLALDLNKTDAQPRVLGLTASFTYAVSMSESQQKLHNICQELCLSAIETATQSELQRGGYHANCTLPLVPNQTVADACVPAGVLPPHLRQPHLMLETFLQRCQDGSATVVACMTMAVVQAMETALSRQDAFETQVQSVPNIRRWSSNAYRLAKQSKCARLKAMYEQLCHWYEALRTLVISWEEDDFACVGYLKMMQCNHVYTFQRVWQSWPDVSRVIHHFWTHAPRTFTRLQVLKTVLLQQHHYHGLDSGSTFRGIVFVQQRISTHILQHFIQTDAQLSKMFHVGCLYATSTSASPVLSVSKTQAASTLERFAKGSINVLIATSVAEEGMDIPAANCVIRFDMVHSTVSFVQGRGRARQQNSCFVVLKQREDRDSRLFVEVERQQMQLLRQRMA
ncbi:unnamed protein product [Agarophyton chilense]|eukprot:gb/GEZJ01003605.1/.p1 GENE.gb/GEZJ01003605.1/~~gb/GEZJ01003605.1/.p1  ORF type:complete len:573 (-),score=74.22 gb/GEZJ01003605.1/:2454-4103(-)